MLQMKDKRRSLRKSEPWLFFLPNHNISIIPVDEAQWQRKQPLSISCPPLSSCHCHHLPPLPYPLHTSSILAVIIRPCKSRALRGSCCPLWDILSQLPGPLSWPPRGREEEVITTIIVRHWPYTVRQAPPTHKVLDDFTKTSNFSRSPFIMTNRNQSL